MKETTKNFLIALGFGIAGVSVTGAVYMAVETHNMKKMLAGSAARISQMSHVDIDRSLVDRMVQKSVHDQASSVCRTAAERIQNDVTADLRNRVKQAVANQTASISKQVAKKIAEEMSETDKDDIVESVVEATTERLVEKLGDEIEDETSRLGKVVQGIVAAMR